jgi:putative peptide zinc metalloprotease protein
MNITRALTAALPEVPARSMSDRPPRVPPDAVFKEHLESGEAVVRVLVPSQDVMYRFPPQNWALIQLFDGCRSFEEIAEIYSGQTGHEFSADEIREFAATLETLNFWYKTPREKNIQLMQMSVEERRKLLKSRKSKFGDLSEITFPAFNPDKFVTWVHRHTSFIYTWWFSGLSLVALAITAAISVTHWSEIGRDTLEFFNFTHKTWGDIFVFYIMAVVVLGIHEFAHAHACKHYGGGVPAMGFLLIYLTPAFYTDASEGFIKGTSYQRFIISMAGVWSELLICAVATPIWWGTPPGTAIHDMAYLLMLMTGISCILINWNPLMPLDGYYMLSEVLGIADLKEDSTAYVTAWVKRKIWGLPVEIPYVPRRRRLGFAVYAILSGVYTYTVLYILARFVGNVFRNFNPEWSFVPELATAALIFRSRIRTLVNFMKFVYLDKKDRLRVWLGSRQALIVGGAFTVFMVLPLWHESVTGRFALEPAQQAVVRARVPGTITDVYAEEGMAVESGSPLVRLRNLRLRSKAARTAADYSVASMRATFASLHYANLGPAIEERNQLAQRSRQLEAEESHLYLTSPLSGTVLTPRLNDCLGAYVPEGTALVEVADLRQMRARIHVSEHDMYMMRVGLPARLQVEGIPRIWPAQTVAVTAVSAEINSELAGQSKYAGFRPPRFFLVDLMISNADNKLKPGMVGSARIYTARRSLAGLIWRGITRFWGRKIW